MSDAMRIVELCDELEKARRYYLELDDYRKVMQAEIERLRADKEILQEHIRELAGLLGKEYERCAQVAEDHANKNYPYQYWLYANEIAAAIRALKDEP
jgi:hypothetical protein